LPISRERKEELVAQYVELLNKSNGFAVIASAGMDVQKVQELRKKIYEAGGTYVVTKNTLLRIALEQAGWSVPTAALEGPTAVAIAEDNFPGVAKAVLEYVKEGENATKMQIKGGVMGGQRSPQRHSSRSSFNPADTPRNASADYRPHYCTCPKHREYSQQRR
jgi:large subunit ribosomal protein L10